MKTEQTITKTAVRTLCKSLLVILMGTLLTGQVHGQIIYETNGGSNTIGEYDATTGAAINTSLVSGLKIPPFSDVSGGNMYVANEGSNTIGEYNATTGAAVNTSLVSGLNNPNGIAVSGGNLWVANYNSGTIGEYNA